MPHHDPKMVHGPLALSNFESQCSQLGLLWASIGPAWAYQHANDPQRRSTSYQTTTIGGRLGVVGSSAYFGLCLDLLQWLGLVFVRTALEMVRSGPT